MIGDKNRRLGLAMAAIAWLIIFGIVGYNFLAFLHLSPAVQKYSEKGRAEQAISAVAGKSMAKFWISKDGKRIMKGKKELLRIENSQIFNFFANDSQLCDKSNLTTVERTTFCKNKQIFKQKARFKSMIVSPDTSAIGFVIETDELVPDTVVGIFYPWRTRDNIHFLTAYYLGNDFLNFSPKGTYFVYKWNCWEAKCSLYIRETKTLAGRYPVKWTTAFDERTQDATFMRWVSENELEYLMGDHLKHISLEFLTP